MMMQESSSLFTYILREGGNWHMGSYGKEEGGSGVCPCGSMDLLFP